MEVRARCHASNPVGGPSDRAAVAQEVGWACSWSNHCTRERLGTAAQSRLQRKAIQPSDPTVRRGSSAHRGNTQAGSRDGALTRWVPPFRRRARVACFHLSRQKDAGRCPHRPCVVRLQAAGAVAIFGAALDLWCRRRATDDTRRYLLAHSGISATAARPEG